MCQTDFLLILADISLWFKPPWMLHEHGCECEHVRGSTHPKPHLNLSVLDLGATFCSPGATWQPKKCPGTLGMNHSLQPTSYLWHFPEMSFFFLYIFSFKSPAVQNHYNHHWCPRQTFFSFFALFLQQEVITDRSSLILPENQPKFPIASGHELPSLGACHLIRTERWIWYLEYGESTWASV